MITCPKCGMTSYNPHDEREGYCGNCHEFTQTWSSESLTWYEKNCPWMTAEEKRQALQLEYLHREIPALYEIARDICHKRGLPWTDPRTGVTYPPPKKVQTHD